MTVQIKSMVNYVLTIDGVQLPAYATQVRAGLVTAEQTAASDLRLIQINVLESDTRLVGASRDLTDDDDGETLECTATVTLTVPPGLKSDFNCDIIPFGTTTVAAGAGVLLNGAGTPVERVAVEGAIFRIVGRGSVLDSYVVTPTSVGGGEGGVTDHGALTGLGDDDHAQYHNNARGDARYSALGHGHAEATTGAAGFMSALDKAKLDGVQEAATANATDAQLRDRTTHTGSQLASTISDFSTAADARIAAQRGAADGLASLDSAGLVPASQLPSYVDDVLEFADEASFPGTGETGKIYVAIDVGAVFRWSGSAYVNIGSAPQYASQAEAEAGAENTKTMTALRTAQAIAARARDVLLTGISFASSADVSATDSIVAAFGKLQAKWNAFAASVRAVVLTGIDIATTGAVAATDTVLQAIGKLQATKSDAVTAGTTISASRALVAADVGKLFTVDTSSGAVELTLNTGVLSSVKDSIYFRRSGANALTVVSGTATVSNPSSVVCADGDMIALVTTAANAGLLIGNVAAGAGDALTTNPLSQFAATTSAQLRSVLSDETGTGAAVFADSPALSGTPTAPTADPGTNTTQLATTAFVQAMRDALLNSAPGALDTLDELAAALGDDANFATTVTNALAAKANLESPALSGTPTAPTAAAGTNSTQIASTAFVRTSHDRTQNSQSAAYTTVLSDARADIIHPGSDATARTFTIDNDVAYPLSTRLPFFNRPGAGDLTIAITGTGSPTLRRSDTGETTSHVVASGGYAVAVKLEAGAWDIDGAGLTSA